MSDVSYISSCVTRDGSARLIFANTTSIMRYRSSLEPMSDTSVAVMGRALTAASIMGSMGKTYEEKLTLQVRGDGPAGNVTAVSDSWGNVRACMDEPMVELPNRADGKIDVGGAVGSGSLIVMKDLGLKEPYTAVCELVSGEIAEDVTSYYARSEQTPTVCALGVRIEPDMSVSVSAGFMLQLLPFYDEGIIDLIEKNLTDLPSVTDMVFSGMDDTAVFDRILRDIPYDPLDRHDIEYRCNCSRERYYTALMSLGEDEIRSLAQAGEPVETVCSFCRKKYVFATDGNTILEKEETL
ncbi:MAG: Hsp33 family molecular chaperone HslO [Eubacteriaceae bacterium]|nr:Hsp33 family molecular chaperone HslO [Eubacteriaceae bacterium]